MTREFFDVKDDDYTDDLVLCVGVWSIIFLVFFVLFCRRMLLLVLWLMSCYCGWICYQYGRL